MQRIPTASSEKVHEVEMERNTCRSIHGMVMHEHAVTHA